MDKKDYEEVIYVVKGLTEMIDHIRVVIDEIPEIMLIGKSLIPKRTEDVSTEYIKFIAINHHTPQIAKTRKK